MSPKHSMALLVSPLAVALAAAAHGQCETQILTASDAAMSDWFGISVALAGDVALVGAHGDDDLGERAGAAYVFRRGVGGWSEAAKLLASNGAAEDNFGGSVAVSAGTAVVGSYANVPGGAAYIFEEVGGAWVEQQLLRASDGASDDAFGISLAIRGDRLLVGASQDDHAGPASGSVYVFERGPAGWVETQKLVAGDAGGDAFGSAVALTDDALFVGASQGTGVGPFTGTAYVFEDSPTGWVETAKLFANDGQLSDSFGQTLAASGDTVIIGASANGHGGLVQAGAAYVYDRTPQGWTQTTKLTASNAAEGDFFGLAVALDDDTALVGANRYFNLAANRLGAVYVFERSPGGWAETAEIHASDEASNDQFGAAVALAEGEALVGALWNDSSVIDTGSAYAFSLGATENYCVATPNSTGGAAAIAASGCPSISSGTFALTATPVPDQTGIFFYGTDETQAPFGNGLLCITGMLFRLPVTTAAGGVLSHSPDFTNPPTAAGQITPGSTWRFQAWFRDPAAGGALFDLSDAVSVRFSP